MALAHVEIEKRDGVRNLNKPAGHDPIGCIQHDLKCRTSATRYPGGMDPLLVRLMALFDTRHGQLPQV